jgi:hypothetical protein
LCGDDDDDDDDDLLIRLKTLKSVININNVQNPAPTSVNVSPLEGLVIECYMGQ